MAAWEVWRAVIIYGAAKKGHVHWFQQQVKTLEDQQNEDDTLERESTTENEPEEMHETIVN